jgi:alkanesulfonate monooxygenase SsuD/methylene tetrahydromethanopterin reductase-like flavin-dependent oxidoreductase (luciferase family)
MKLGLALPHYDASYPGPGPATFERIERYARLAESSGFFQVWVSDHFWIDPARYGGPPGRNPTPECWTTLTALAARTTTVRLGTLVLAVGFRPPALLASMAVTLDQLSGGRLDVGLGAGWNQAEHEENGLPFPRPGERLAMLEEALGVLAVRRAGAAPPLWVGGARDRLLGVVARAADGWNICWSVTPAAYEERLGALRMACERAGRPLEEVRRSLGLATLLGRDADDLAARWRRLQAWTPGGALDGVELRDWAASRLAGTPDQVLEQLRGWEARGVEQVVANFAGVPFSVFEDEQLDLAAELVLPRLG